MYIYIYKYMCVYIYIYTHTNTHAHSHTHSLSLSHTHKYTHSLTSHSLLPPAPPFTVMRCECEQRFDAIDVNDIKTIRYLALFLDALCVAVCCSLCCSVLQSVLQCVAVFHIAQPVAFGVLFNLNLQSQMSLVSFQRNTATET